jgi:hypothetical protein
MQPTRWSTEHRHTKSRSNRGGYLWRPESRTQPSSLVGALPTCTLGLVCVSGHCCFGEEYASITVDCDSSDGERELGERSREPMPRVNVGGQFVVAAANILDKGVAEADHPYGTDLFETAHRP